ncbi:hypothetical protein RYX36_006109 [Vicia faba]
MDPYALAKLTSLPFQRCHHSIITVDCQWSGVNGGMLVFVSGNLQFTGKQHAFKFNQVQIGSHSFLYDYVYDSTGQSLSAIYDNCVALLVDALFNGYKAIVLA